MAKRIVGKRVSHDVMLSVIVPTYRERENIAELIEGIESSLGSLKFEIIVVDDSSPDGTAEVAEELNIKYGNVKVLKRAGKLGLSSAILDGVGKANAGILAVMDADLQHPPEMLQKMYDKIREGNDLVLASRYVNGGAVKGWSLRRRIMSRGAIFLAHMLFPKTRNVDDVVSGFFMFRKSVIETARLNPVGYKILLEILVRGNYSSLAEVPYVFESRRKGTSNLNFKEIWNYVIHMHRLRNS